MDSFDFQKDPFENFLSLYKNAEARQVYEPHAMVLSTLGLQGRPSSRVVFYKGLVRGGLSFYTNYEGQKSKEIEKNPAASLNFYWPTLEQQIRVVGLAEKMTREESEKYFRTRPRLSQIGAWASLQSQLLKEGDLEKRIDEFTQKFNGQEVPCPPHWGGFIVRPDFFEFWFGRQGRLHERFIYELHGGSWKRLRKFP